MGFIKFNSFMSLTLSLVSLSIDFEKKKNEEFKITDSLTAHGHILSFFFFYLKHKIHNELKMHKLQIRKR